VLVPVSAEPGRSSLHASIDGLSCELDVLEEWDGNGERSPLEISDPLPRGTSENVLSGWTVTALPRRDKGRGVGAEELHDAAEGDVGVRGDGASIESRLVETSDGDLSDRVVGPTRWPRASEGLVDGFEPETPPLLALANGSNVAEPEDNADPGRAALNSSGLSPTFELERSP